jgi:hypothetical protein
MNTANLKLCIIPSDAELSRVENYYPDTDGKIFSTLTEIKVNKVPDGYSILYRANDIKNMDISVLGNNIIKLFMKNIPDTMINIKMIYMYQVIDNNGDSINQIDIPVIHALLKLEEKFTMLPKGNGFFFNYIRSENLVEIIKGVINSCKDIDDDYDDDLDDEDDADLSDYFESLGIHDNYMDDDDDYDDDDEEDNSLSILEAYMKDQNNGYVNSSKSKIRKKGYPESRILDTAKNPKRSYNRHGVIICNDKESRKRDEKILKEFLKDFFPGDAEWRKEFRKDVLKRWMKMYSISKRDLKELEKTHRKAKNAKRNNVKTEKTLDFTRRLFNVPIDRWNDPSR